MLPFWCDNTHTSQQLLHSQISTLFVMLQRRLLTSGEYTQMAGRAGRRGLDKTGAVLVGVWTDLYPQADVKSVMIGKGQKLQSQFRLTYLMICSLLRVEDLKVEDMMRRSFAEFHAQRALGNSLAPLQRAEAELAQLRAHPWPGGEDEEDRACFRRYAKLTARCQSHCVPLNLDAF